MVQGGGHTSIDHGHGDTCGYETKLVIGHGETTKDVTLPMRSSLFVAVDPNVADVWETWNAPSRKK